METSAGSRYQEPAIATALRVCTELAAWVGTPWALWHVSPVLALAVVVVMIALPGVFATRGDKAKPIVAVPGYVTIFWVVLYQVAAVVSAWLAWWPAVAIVVSVVAVATTVTELPRWRWLLTLA